MYGHRAEHSIWGPFRGIDGLLLLQVLSILALGMVLIHSATFPSQGLRLTLRQGVWAGLGMALCLGLSWVRPRTLSRHAWGLWGACILLVLGTYWFGVEAFGARRWLIVGGLRFQPSEFLKIGTIVLLARLASHYRDRPEDRLQSLAAMAGVAATSFLVIAKQPDLGTAATVFAVSGSLFVAMGVPLWALFSLVLLGILPLGTPAFLSFLGLSVSWASSYPVYGVLGLGFLAAWGVLRLFRSEVPAWKPGLVFLSAGIGIWLGPRVWEALNPYQRLRLTGFLAPELDPRGSGYNLLQSLIAIGSGGIWGQGLGQGSQTNLGFVPHKHTDFIFSVLGEQLGYAGVVLLLALFGGFFLRLFWLAGRLESSFGSLLICGVAGLFAFQTLVNLGMSLGMAPITGIPLPFVSYGGSALIGYFALLGLVQAVVRDHGTRLAGSGISTRNLVPR